jgi:O-antigen/teichoic acid export membrane protein
MSSGAKPVTGILQGSAIFMAASLLMYLARFAISIIVARSLGPDGKGIYVLVITVAAFLGLFFNFGFNSALTYYTAGRAFEARDLFSFSTYAALGCGLLASLIFYPLYNFRLSETLLVGIQPMYILLVLVMLPLNLWSVFSGSILLGKQLLVQYNLISLIQIAANLVMQILSAWRGFGLPGAILAWAASGLLGFCVTLWFTRHEASLRPSTAKNILKPAFRYGAKSYFANLMTFFNYRLDAFLVNFFSGAGAVGLYTTSVSTAEILYYVPNGVSSALFPKVPGLKPETASALTARLSRLVLLVLVPVTILFGLAGAILIPFVFGEQFGPSVTAFLLLLPGIIGISLSKILSADLSGRGKPHYATYTALCTLALTILLDIIMIPRYGINGAAIASSIAYLSSAGLLSYWFCSETGSALRELLVPTTADLHLVQQRSQSTIQRLRTK